MNKELTKRQIIFRITLFLLIIGLVFVYLNMAFKYDNSDMNKKLFNTFYAQEENTIDAVYVGTSATNRYFNDPLCYEESGATVFNLATMGMPMFLYSNVIEEAEKYQNPQLYIIEMRWVLKSREQITDAHVRRVTDSMKFGSNRNDAISKSLEFTEGVENDMSENAIDYYFPILKYTGMLSDGELPADNILLRNTQNPTMGYAMTPNTVVVKEQKEAVYSDGRADLTAEAEETLVELLDYLDALDKDVLFVLSPYSVREGDKDKFNTAIDIVESRGYDVVDFNTPEMIRTLGIDWKKDFYNSKHVNYMGAEKYTRYLTAYIEDNYDLPDHRDDSRFGKWDESYEAYLQFIDNHELKYKQKKM